MLVPRWCNEAKTSSNQRGTKLGIQASLMVEESRCFMAFLSLESFQLLCDCLKTFHQETFSSLLAAMKPG